MKIQTDICIVGAGPIGLFAVFQAGLLKMRCQVVDVWPEVGGKRSEICPNLPEQGLMANLMEQINPFYPGFTLGERIEEIILLKDGSFVLLTNNGTQIGCKAIVIAGGMECFEPRNPVIEYLSLYEGKGVIPVDKQDYQTNIPGVYAIGEINNYPGKMEFFLPGFREAALVSQSAFKYVHPLEQLRFECNGLNVELI